MLERNLEESSEEEDAAVGGHMKKGLNPDLPGNLSLVVLLDDDKSRVKPEHASI